MSISILLPALSPSMEKGNIVRWLKKEGDGIKVGDVIAEIETDKATMEIEAFDDGILSRIVRAGGCRDVPVNEVIAILSSDDVAAGYGASGGKGAAVMPDRAMPVRPPPADRQSASPLARRIARAQGIDLSGLVGSGPHGRIVRRDVEAQAVAMPAGPRACDAVPAEAGSIAASGRVMKLFEPGTYEEIRLDGMRRTIASRLVEAKATIPHFYLSIDCGADALLALRGELNAVPSRPGGGRLTVNDLAVKALALAMQAVPEANVVWAEDRMLRFRNCDIAVAVSVEGGLYTPVIRNADIKTVSAISAEVRDLAARARSGSLAPHEYSGGSASISNLGMYGISDFQPIINPPHAFILGVGAIEERLVSRNGQPTSIHAFTVTMSCDHRAVDGALAARLLAAFKSIVEEPMRILV